MCISINIVEIYVQYKKPASSIFIRHMWCVYKNVDIQKQIKIFFTPHFIHSSEETIHVMRDILLDTFLRIYIINA